MDDVVEMTPSQHMALHSAARVLHAEFRGVLNAETIEGLLVSTYEELAATATVTRFLTLTAERFARERLYALIEADREAERTLPAVMFLGGQNAGRSQMALGWLKRLAGRGATGWSVGSRTSPVAVAAMAEVGIDISREVPRPFADGSLRAADAVVTMGSGDASPLFAGKHYEDWEVAVPSGTTVAEMRPIRDEIGRRVNDLLDHLAVQRA